MASKVVGTEWRGEGRAAYVVEVEHHIADSFSRSVDRAAGNAWKRLPRHDAARMTFMAGNYGHTAEGKRCWSTVAFAVNRDEAYKALGIEPPF